MSVLVKTPRIKFEVNGKVPGKVKRFLIKEYGKENVFLQKSEDEYISFKDTDWYIDIQKEITLGKRIKAYRDRDNLTQEALGRSLGHSKQYVSDLENDRRGISKEVAVKLASIFKTRADRFL